MSELINTHDNRATIRWKLLTSASALALVSAMSVAKAEDADRPLIWIELGGQMENVSGQGDVFAPAFLAQNSTSSVLGPASPLQAQKPSTFSFGEEGKISFQPEDSDWVFSAAIRYGRSGDFRHIHHQTYGVFYTAYEYGVPKSGQNIRGIDKFADTQAHRQEHHAILDFQVGKDVGLGMLGKGSSSTLSVGVRFAQFASSAAFEVRARPDLQFENLAFPSHHFSFHFPYYQTYHATGDASRSFRGVGPSLSWSASALVAGNEKDGELMVDWGVNVALLFGKQKARVQHQESEHYVNPSFVLNGYRYTAYQHNTPVAPRARNVTVSNLGGSIGLSWRVQDFKVSMGYRADVFFGAMDGGIDARKSQTLGFKGPYASISIGLGD